MRVGTAGIVGRIDGAHPVIAEGPHAKGEKGRGARSSVSVRGLRSRAGIQGTHPGRWVPSRGPSQVVSHVSHVSHGS